MKPIGGFFELDLPSGESLYHDQAVALSTGRACLGLLIEELQPSKVYLPYYSCEAFFKPFQEQYIPFQFYPINNRLELLNNIELKDNEYLIYINYFGIKNDYSNSLTDRYKDQIILDNTHAFFEKDQDYGYSFTSARKYFGVPDGAFLYGLKHNKTYTKLERFTKASIAHGIHRLMGNQAEAFALFQKYEESLDCSMLRISKVSEKLLKLIDYDKVRSKRKENFEFLDKQLKAFNELEWGLQDCDPFCYPFLPKRPLSKADFHKEKLFVPTLWPDVLQRNDLEEFPLSKKLTTDLLPLPIDHRYTKADMARIVSFIRILL